MTSCGTALIQFSALRLALRLLKTNLRFQTYEELTAVAETILGYLPADEYPHVTESDRGARSAARLRQREQVSVGLDLILDDLEQAVTPASSRSPSRRRRRKLQPTGCR